MATVDKNLQHLCEQAKGYGALRVSVISADQIVVDPRVRLKCLVPACPHYGVNLMCPPRMMDPEAFGSILDRYSDGIIVQFPIEISPQSFGSLEEAMENSDYTEALSESSNKMTDALCCLEREAMALGYRFASALGGGHCRLCDECVGQDSGAPCRHPFRARPSMEALGIDVFQTAKNAGVPMEEEPVWTGLVLLD